LFEDFEIEIHCPECDAELEVKLSQIKLQKNIPCPECHKNIGLKPDESPSTSKTQDTDDSLASIKQILDRLQKSQS